VPKDYQGKPENILVAVQWGREVGLGPLQALQNISVINGRPAIWGDAMLALVRGSPKCLYVHEDIDGENEAMTATCRCARRDQEGEIVSTFSVDDAKKANLWGRQGPWTQYPKRMVQMRARGFALRDGFPDVLRGVISMEEAQDIPPDRPARRDQAQRLDAKYGIGDGATEHAHATANERMKAAGEALAKEATGYTFIGPDGLDDAERGAPYDGTQDVAGQIIRALQNGRLLGDDGYREAKDAHREAYSNLDEKGRARVQAAMKELE